MMATPDRGGGTSGTTPSDTYAAVGEFHDLFMDEAWDRLVPTLTRAFGTLDAGAVLLDLGAGSGVGTRRLAGVTRASVVAVEPSVTMRSVLLAGSSTIPP